MNDQTPVPFLALPKAVRETIYMWCGLTRPCPIDLVSERHRRKARYVVHDMCISIGKKKTCTYLKHLRNSAEPRSRAERAHFICYGPVLPLSLLRVCKMVHLEALQLFYSANKFQLRVLQESDLFYLRDLSPRAISSLTSLHIDLGGSGSSCLPFDTSRDPKRSEDLIDQWTSILQVFAQSVLPSSLNFAFTCPSADLDPELAKQLLASLEWLPPLRGCALSIGGQPAASLRPLVQATAAQLLKLPATSGQFPFEKLPKELRMKILEQTNLAPKKHASSAYGVLQVFCWNGRLRDLGKCCSRCNDCLESCCCLWLPAAYSRTCSCTYPPTALFKVNRQMSCEAQDVFFSKNLFILTAPLSSTSFLDVLNDTQLARIRRLEIYFWQQECWWDLLEKEHPMRWYRLVDTMKAKLDIRRLELRVNFFGICRNESTNTPRRKTPLLRMSKQVLAPLRQLNGLLKLFIYCFSDKLDAEDETEIMGPAYDSAKEGKPPGGYDYPYP